MFSVFEISIILVILVIVSVAWCNYYETDKLLQYFFIGSEFSNFDDNF